MRDNKQILDVTFGTFSCRLEGFDDSVETMKQIATFLSTLRDKNSLPDSGKAAIDIAALAKLTGAVAAEDATTTEKSQLRLRHPNFAPDADLAETPDDAPDLTDSESVTAKMDRIRAVIGRGDPDTAKDNDIDEIPDSNTSPPPLRMTPLAARLADLAQRKAAGNLSPDMEEAQTNDADDPAIDDHDPAFAAADDTTAAMMPQTAGDAPDALSDTLLDADADDPRPKRHDLSPTADAMVDRILSQTDDEINAPALRLQRLSFAQLKAASVAKDAARQLGDDDDGAQLNIAYRDDLDDLSGSTGKRDVPDTPADDDSGARDEEDIIDFADDSPDTDDPSLDPLPPLLLSRPVNPSKLPPLRLIASQRVVDPVKPVGAEQRLRQIVSQIDPSGPAPVSFAAFVAMHNITDLSEMIVAAAAYVNFVQGSADFSRPEVMRLVRAQDSDAVAREQGVRLFGRLVTQERIIRLDNGRFRVADDTPYRPAARTARG